MITSLGLIVSTLQTKPDIRKVKYKLSNHVSRFFFLRRFAIFFKLRSNYYPSRKYLSNPVDYTRSSYDYQQQQSTPATIAVKMQCCRPRYLAAFTFVHPWLHRPQLANYSKYLTRRVINVAWEYILKSHNYPNSSSTSQQLSLIEPIHFKNGVRAIRQVLSSNSKVAASSYSDVALQTLRRVASSSLSALYYKKHNYSLSTVSNIYNAMLIFLRG